MHLSQFQLSFAMAACWSLLITSVPADELRLNREVGIEQLTGEILIEARDGSLLFEANDGQLSILTAEQIEAKTEDNQPVAPITQDAMAEQLLAELPEGFRIYKTKHYVFAYQNNLAYAQWVAGLYDGHLYRGFEKFWDQRKKFELTEPPWPMAVVVFGSKLAYEQYVQRELGGPAGAMVAYYNLMTNRVAMYDLTSEHSGVSQPTEDERHIREVLSNPRAIPMVATIIHEGTHQLMFNRGLQRRLGYAPLWLNEGIALFFETPDLKSSRGWRVPGKVNPPRMQLFIQNYRNRPADAIEKMIGDDEPFRNEQTGLASYADAWALNHFLLNRRSDEMVEYLKYTSSQPPLTEKTPAERLADFKKFFGDDLAKLEEDFIDYMRKLR